MVSLAILATVMVPLLLVRERNLGASVRAAHALTAVALARTRIEEFKVGLVNTGRSDFDSRPNYECQIMEAPAPLIGVQLSAVHLMLMYSTLDAPSALLFDYIKRPGEE